MSFTCPDCLWTSQHIDDVTHRYCGRCHEFKQYSFGPTPFQTEVIKVLRGQDEPTPLLRRLVGQYRMQQASLGEIYIELSQMLTASLITYRQREALSVMLNMIEAVANLAEGSPTTNGS